LHPLRALDQRVDLGQLALGEVAQRGVGGLVGVRAEQRADLVKCEASLLGDVDHAEATDGLGRVAALAGVASTSSASTPTDRDRVYAETGV
jgi:hypothetical protein